MSAKTEGTFNCKHISDNGAIGPWESKYLILTEYDFKVKENADDTITRSIINLCDVVEVGRDESDAPPKSVEDLEQENNSDVELGSPKFLLKMKTRYNTGWIIEMESEQIFDEWSSVMERKKGVLRESDINPPPPPPVRGQKDYKSDYTLRDFFDNRRMMGEMWMVYAFIAYTILLSILFALLWTLYVLPEKNIVEIPTTCHIISSEAEYVWKRNYNLNIYVSYNTTEGELTNKMVQYCSGTSCPSKMVEKYPVGSDKECHYDEANPNYVFFDLSQMVRKRYTITFGLCGGLFGPWIICVVVMLITRWKTFSKMMKNTFCSC
ncbi:hypothetical protein DICPUDRAFT_74948 [Dictyostelium purpureum]|uniref:PH domain-containing protein n=1 Tax=Dictyostelium purpureum TaxID=5786 RepID=F0Z976_DICPU|nr:uncharacterized protein DICPUDRAFT_74948 [Dictyostelium purpureum]EGC39532.1 hypothetical protein DICPUDRAFT_74948 [Dictyostelium purpureum]|eukprot:XP_003283979.1 hypothetical protein DICPUDRAFT_74948 [Dictyostelium purpureum]